MPFQETREFNFTNFRIEFNLYKRNRDSIFRLKNNEALLLQVSELTNLDVKLRLAFAIKEIQLDNNFVSDKYDELKLCHLFYYKLSDLWFAYETYIKFYKQVFRKKKDKITWLSEKIYCQYENSLQIVKSLADVNTQFSETYSNKLKQEHLINYLENGETLASLTQKKRLGSIISKIRSGDLVLSNTEVLTIIYTIRNNFVHNGETTIVPDNFGFENKSKLLQILYPYLCLVILKSINITCNQILTIDSQINITNK